MLLLLYNIGIGIYWCLAHVAAPFYPKAKLWCKGRKQWLKQLQQAMEQTAQQTVWIHCSSLGEFEQGRPIIEAIKALNPQQRIVLTFFSPSGYEIRKNYALADYVCYLPLDTRRNAARFVATIRPSVAIFVKYEFWYHYLNTLSKNNIATYVISAIFRPQQAFFKPYGGWYRRFLRRFTHLFVQDPQSEQLLQKNGVENVTVCGDTRFDRVLAIAQKATAIAEVERFCAQQPNAPTLVAGSTWPPDEDLLAQYMRSNPSLRLIIAPHEVHEAHIKSVEDKLAFAGVVRYSQLHDSPNNMPASAPRVLIIDTIGLLSAIYRYGQIAYIGGGFGVGIHNTLEAAVYGMPVLFGPNHKRFNEALGLIAAGGATGIANANELKHSLDALLANHNKLEQSAKAAANYVQSMSGATTAIMQALKSHL